MIRVLVSGAGGQLGKSIQDLVPAYPSLDILLLDKTGMDITRADQVREIFKKYQPDYCINCAAYTNVDQAEITPEPAFTINVAGTENLARACRETETVLIHISTDYVFDGKNPAGYYPADTPNPINVYGQTKWQGEQIIQQCLQRFFIIRTSWLYSKKYPPNFYLTILEKAQRGEQLVVTDEQTGCPTDASNFAKHILHLIESGSTDYGISHFTDGEAMSWYAFAAKVVFENNLQERVELIKGTNHTKGAKRPASSILLAFRPPRRNKE